MGCNNTSNKKIKNGQIKEKNEKIKGVGESPGLNEVKPNFYENNMNRISNTNNKKEIEIIEEDDTKEIPKNCVHVKVGADTTEILFPVWMERGVNTKILVRGKWSLFPDYGMVNYKGHSNFNSTHRDAHIGALMARVQGGNYFPIVNGMVINSEVSGPIYLFANNSRFPVNPTGSLDVYFEHAKKYTVDEIENMLGWNIKELDTTKGHDYLTTEEKMQIIFLNKIKSNPKQFAQQYLIHLVELGQSYREIFLKLQHYPVIKLLRPCKALYLAARDHSKDIGDNGTTGHKSTDGTDLRTRISRYCSNPSYFGENCSYGEKDPLSIVIQMLVDDGFQTRAHRANILNEIYTQIGLSVQNHASYRWNCVQVFGSNITDNNHASI